MPKNPMLTALFSEHIYVFLFKEFLWHYRLDHDMQQSVVGSFSWEHEIQTKKAGLWWMACFQRCKWKLKLREVEESKFGTSLSTSSILQILHVKIG